MAFRILLVLIGGAALIAAAGCFHLAALQRRVREAWSQVDVCLRQRHELAASVAETLEQAAAPERDRLERLRAAGRDAAAVGGIPERAEAENRLTGELRRLPRALGTQAGGDDPELRGLQARLSAAESEIMAAQQCYNLQVMTLNRRIHQFPWRLIARGYRPAEYLILDEPAGCREEPLPF